MTTYRGYKIRREGPSFVISFLGEDIDTVGSIPQARRVIDEWMWSV